MWGESLSKVFGVDVSEPMLEMARKLLEVGALFKDAAVSKDTALFKDAAVFKDAVFRRYLSLSGRTKYDLVVGAFVLSELPDDGVRKLSVDALWQQTGSVLVRDAGELRRVGAGGSRHARGLPGDQLGAKTNPCQGRSAGRGWENGCRAQQHGTHYRTRICMHSPLHC